ncbi:MAG TPA: family 16 glycosylhydrolase [Sediminibacterium sp.]|nr:family 16 glycosylhydrolase [Sediminibacterium sp.]
MIRITVCLLLITCTASCGILKPRSMAPVLFADNIVVAHRGAFKKNKLPENSIAALKQSIALNCTGSEFDVRMTSDDSLIINHDPDFKKLPIEQTTYSELIKHRLSNGEKLPTLREYLLAGLENNTATRLVCEIKPSELNKERGQRIAAKTVALVHALRARERVVYISFDYDILKKIVSLDPGAPTQYLNGDRSPEQLKADGITGADYHYAVFKKYPEWIVSAKQLNIALNAWTVNDAETMEWLMANDFEFITTNEPELLMELMQKTLTRNGWKLVWSDEFNYQGLPDSTRWGYHPGAHGGGNDELQYYTAGDTLNAVVSNGVLKIIARKEARENKAYTSSKLQTRNKAAFTYGRIEVRAKLPAGRGTWPAVWMLGTNIDAATWPACGEIDIMEHVGYEKDSIYGTIHSDAYNHIKGTQKGKAIYTADPYSRFHVYAIEWTPEKIDFMMDGVVYNHIRNEHLSVKEWPFDAPFYLILNLAIGGGWGGKKGVDDAIFPAIMEVDWVRVFQSK